MEYKTNVMRILDKLKINYNTYNYSGTGAISGVEVAKSLNQDEKRVFKTLVTIAKSHNYYVFMIPVAEELDLKKCATSVNEKSIEMLPSKELLSLTGYIHGGCSPIGMRKQFTTIIHETASLYPTIIFSAGKIGYQVEMNINDLNKAIPVKLANIIVSEK